MLLDEGNQSSVNTFILLGFSEYPHLQGTALPGFLDHLYSHCGREPGHNCCHKDQSQTPYTHIIFPQPSIIFVYLLFQCAYNQIARNLGCGRQNYLLQEMHSTIFLCAFVITEMFMLAVMTYDQFMTL